MTKTEKPTSNLKTYTRDLADGARLEAEVSPCVFMYPGYPLQLTVTLRGGSGQHLGQVYPADRTKNADTYRDDDAKKLLATVQTKPCPRCSTPAFDPASVETNRGGLCEVCFLADLNAELAAELAREQAKVVARDRRMKKKGMAVRVTAWVHPDDGDDYQLDWYLKEQPTADEVRKVLRRRRSAVLDDYQIIAL